MANYSSRSGPQIAADMPAATYIIYVEYDLLTTVATILFTYYSTVIVTTTPKILGLRPRD